MKPTPARIAALSLLWVQELAPGAPINWAPVIETTRITDISTHGELVEAKNATRDGFSPVVMVGGEAIRFDGTEFPAFTTATGDWFTNGGGDTGSDALNQVFSSLAILPTWEFPLAGLEIGTGYQIQFLVGGDTRAELRENHPQRVGDGQVPENVSGEMTGSGPGSVIGTFIADSDSQTIRILSNFEPPGGAAMSGYILRRLPPPAPATDILLSHDRIDLETPTGTYIGSLTAFDPNFQDTHTFALVDSAGSPDNTLFAIASGDQLRAASQLGPEGTRYAIRVRATDSTGLAFDKSFALRVLPPPPITSITYTGDTLQLTAPAVPGRRIGVAYSDTLTASLWIDLGNFAEGNATARFSDPDGVRLGRRAGFYRAFLRPLIP